MYRRMEEEGEQENGRAGEREAAEESNRKVTRVDKSLLAGQGSSISSLPSPPFLLLPATIDLLFFRYTSTEAA